LIPDTYIQDLLSRVDIVDVVGRYVQLRKGGANLLGLCPFHNEKSPSFTVSPTKQFYHCFGCGAHGSAITFLMEHAGSSFPEAVQHLSASVGMTVPEAPRSDRQQADANRRKNEVSRHTQVLDRAQAHYLKLLRASPEAIQYLKGRGLTGEIAHQYGLGWSGRDRQGLMAVFDDYENPTLVEAGMVIESEDGRRYDRFRERVMFPIRNARGTLIGFGGRVLGKGEPKYLNSPETPVFSKGQELYGLWEGKQAIRKEGHVIVVEGYMDVVGLAQLGIGNAVATLGTSTTPDHIKKLLRASDKVVFSFDGDKAGRKAAWRALQACLPALRDDIAIRFLFLPSEHDPDSYVRAFGEQAFRECVSEADALSRFLLDELSARHTLTEAEGRASCLHEARPLLAMIPECALRVQIERELARLVQLTPEEMTRILAQADAQAAARTAAFGSVPTNAAPAARPAPTPPVAVEPPPAYLADLDAQHLDYLDEPPGYLSDPGYGYDGGYTGGEPSRSGDDYAHGMPPSGMPPGNHSGTQQFRRGGGQKSDGWKGGKGGWKGRKDEVQGVVEPRRPVPTLARRLLRLILAHPELVDGMGDEQLEVIDNGPHLGMVRDLIMLAQSSGARHIGALLEAAEPDSDLHALLRSTRAIMIEEEDLPDPQGEWDDALRRIEFDVIRVEMDALAVSGLATEDEKRRYQTLAQRRTVLQRASGKELR